MTPEDERRRLIERLQLLIEHTRHGTHLSIAFIVTTLEDAIDALDTQKPPYGETF